LKKEDEQLPIMDKEIEKEDDQHYEDSKTPKDLECFVLIIQSWQLSMYSLSVFIYKSEII